MLLMFYYIIQWSLTCHEFQVGSCMFVDTESFKQLRLVYSCKESCNFSLSCSGTEEIRIEEGRKIATA